MFNIFKKKNEVYTSKDIDKIIDSHNKLLENQLKYEKQLKLTQKRLEEVELKRLEQFRELTNLIKISNLLNLEEKKEAKSSDSSKKDKGLNELINRKMSV